MSASCEVTVGNGIDAASFDPDIYRASRLVDSNNTETATMWAELSVDTPCELYIPALQESGFETWSTAWTVLTTTFDAVDNVTLV